MTSVAVVGSGIVGRLLAWRLQSQEKIKVCLVDRENFDWVNASAASAGMLAPFCELDHSEAEIFPWGLKSIDMWHGILKSLPKPLVMHQKGTMVVAVASELGELLRFEENVSAKIEEVKAQSSWRPGKNDLPGIMPLNSSEEIAKYEPELSESFQRALYFPYEIHMDSQEILKQLHRGFIEAGGEFILADAGRSISDRSLNLNGKLRKFDWVFDCRGYGAAADFPKLRAVRGEALIVRAPDVHFSRPLRMMHPRYPIYIVPREDQQYFVGATMVETDFSGEITIRSALNLMSALFAVHPGFAEAQILSSRTGLRPAFPDHKPVIETMKSGVTRINGLYRHGYLLSPYLSQVCIENLKRGEFVND